MTLFLDLDDTLVNSEKAYEIGMKAIGIAPTDPEFLQARSQTKKELPPLVPSARSRLLYFKKYLENRQQYSPKKHLELIKKYEDSLLETYQFQWQKANRGQLLKELRKKFGRLGIITNEMTRMQVLKLTVIDPDFQCISTLMTSEEAGVEKPDPKIFQMAIQMAGSAAAECIMVGDTFSTDIEPAIKLGMRAILTTEFKQDMSAPDNVRRITRLEELLQL